MPSTASNRTAALAGAWCAIGGTAYTRIMEFFVLRNEGLQWLLDLIVLFVIFFIPFFKWVVGTDFKANGDGLTMGEQLRGLPEKYSRMGIWFISAAIVGSLANFLLNAMLR
jgi:hypothetical protein